MENRIDDAEITVLRPPRALRAGGGFLVLFPIVFTFLLGRDGEGGYWTQATSVLCMAVVLGTGLVTLSVRLVLSVHELRLVNWTEEWRVPAAAIVKVGADDGLYLATADGKVRSSCAQPSLLGQMTGYRRSERLRRECERYVEAAVSEADAHVVHRRRWELLLLFVVALAGLWVLYSVAYLLR